jgi:UDP-N-acetylglucosamine 2-epimerase
MQHPVTTSYGQGQKQITETLHSLLEFKDIQKIVIWPNIDAGTDDVSKGIRIFRERNRREPIHYFRNFAPGDYARVLNNAVCCVGNSSSFIREGAFLGVPAVIVGDRQEGREHGRNVVFADYDRENIAQALRHHIENGRYESDKLFGDGSAGPAIANKLAITKFKAKKNNTY